MKIVKRLPIAMGIAAAAASSYSPFVLAQDGLFIEEILVTARKQTESIQDVPVALTAFSADSIEQLGIANTEDVIKYSPGLTFSRGIGGQDLRPDIRGLSPLSGRANIAILVDGVDQTTDALTGTGAGQLVALGLYDLERVEVVRGPQSALFGRNAFGGAINYITKKPSSDFEGTLSLEAAEYDTYQTKLSLTGPLTDTVLYRLNATHYETEGQYQQPGTGAHLGQEDTNAFSAALLFLPQDGLEVLTRLDWSKQDKSNTAVTAVPNNACITVDAGAGELSPSASGACATGSTPLYVGTLPDVQESDIALSDQNDFKGMENELLQFTMLINYAVNDSYTFTSNTAVTRAEGLDDFDLDHQPDVTSLTGLFASLATFPWVSAANPLSYHSDREFEREAFFQDFRLSFDEGDDLRWLVGMELSQEDYSNKDYSRANGSIGRDGSYTGSVSDNFVTTAPPYGGPAFPFAQFCNPLGPPVPGASYACVDNTGFIDISGVLPARQNRDTTSYGAYGEVTWMFVEDWELAVSARYQFEKYEVSYDNVDPRYIVPVFDDQKFISPDRPLDAQYVAGPRRIYGKDDFDSLNPRVVLSHYLTDDVMLYGSVAQGSKPGGFTFDSGLDPSNRTYGMEKLLSYEFGWKTSWLDDRIIVNGAVFLMENDDKQANTQQVNANGTRFSYVGNIAESEVQGLELSVTAALARNLVLNVGYAYLDTEIKDFITVTNPGVIAGQTTTLEQSLADPDADVSGNELPFTPKHSVVSSLQYNFVIGDGWEAFARVDGRYMSERYFKVDNYTKINDFAIFDVQAGVTIGDVELVAYVNNVEDDDTISSAAGFVNFAENFRTLNVAYLADRRHAGVRFKYSFY